MEFNTSQPTLGSRSLLSGEELAGTGVNYTGCKGSSCWLSTILLVAIFLFFAALMFAIALYKNWKFSQAIKNGSLPAEMLISQWSVKTSERGDLDAFSFTVRRPEKREDIDEESCPVCLKEKPKATAWLVFGACNHATCNHCFLKLVSDQKLHAACPICRTLLAQGEGNRGKNRSTPGAIEITTESATTTSTTTTTPTNTADVANSPLPPSDNNV